MLKNIASLWIGNRLGPIELASIRSFQRQGHEFTLYSYEPLENCPEGVVQRDAREVLDAGRIIRHRKTQSPALHSDLFRYALIQKTGHLWVDLDIVALRPFEFSGDDIFGFESVDWVNGAVLGFSADSPVLARLAEIGVETRGMPPHLVGLRKVKYGVRNLLAGGLSIDRWPWGAIGPKLITLELRQSGEIAKALPVEAFYSVPLDDAHRFADPGGYRASEAPEGAYAVHLWASRLSRHVTERYAGVFPADSFVNRVCNDDW